jgi:hypothetical protein
VVVTEPEPQRRGATSTSHGGLAEFPTSRATLVWGTGFIGLAVAWFFVSWVVLDSPVVDAVGEAAGGVTVVLLVMAVIGSLLRSK